MRLPSALPLPKKYTCLLGLRRLPASDFVASSLRGHQLMTPVPRFQKYRPAAESECSNRFISRSRACAQRRVVGHDEHVVEEPRDGRLERRRPRRTPRGSPRPTRPPPRSPCSRCSISSSSATSAGSFSSAFAQVAVERRERRVVELARDVAHALERRRPAAGTAPTRENSGSARRFSLAGRPAAASSPRPRSASTARTLPPIGAALLRSAYSSRSRQERVERRPALLELAGRVAVALRAPRRPASPSGSAHARCRSAPRRRARIRSMPCACRRSPNGSRDPVGRSPARNRPTSVSSLSASDTHAQVTRGRRRAPPPSAPRRLRRATGR